MITQQISLALSADSPQSIRSYFEKVRELVKAGNLYPVSLDEVWPLCYVEKGVAVRFLKKQFVNGYDYQTIDKKVKRGTGATVTTEYALSVSCMEFFIARKVRAVFNVYREVFHRVADNIAAKMESLVKINNSLTERVISLETTINRIGKEQTKFFEAKVKADETKYDQDLRIRRDKIMGMMSLFIRRTSGVSWTAFWDAFAISYLIDVRELPHEPGEHFLDVAIRHGHIERVWEMLNWQ